MKTEPQPYCTYKYQITSADALVWRKLRSDWSTAEKLFGIALALALGALFSAMPESMIGSPYDLRFVLALAIGFTAGYALFRLLIELNDRRLSRRDIPAPRHVILEDWVDHLDERWEGGRRSVALEMMGPVLVAPGHVFVQGPSAVIIIPATAFDSPAEKQAFAANLEEMAEKWPSLLEARDD